MKRLSSVILLALVSTSFLLAGGLVTNTNQSAAWIRTQSRNASLDLDAIYYNPAGISQFKNGLSLSISNQSILQTRTITSDYPYLAGTPKSYEAELVAPIFPSVYAAYKMDKWSFSAGFNVIGGGGTADFQTGLPTFEIPVSSMVPQFQGILGPLDQQIIGAGFPDPGFRNVTGYNMNASFTGASAFYGIQAGATYKINDMFSVAIGGRYVIARNSYEGALTDITIDAPAAYGGTQPGGTYLRTVASTPGLPAEAVAQLNGFAGLIDASTADAALKATQEGSGFTPIIGLNVQLSDKLNIAARYEHHTKIELTNKTEVDDVGMFPDGAKTRSDLPGMFSVGAMYKATDKLTATVGFEYFLDKGAYYGNVDANGEQINNESTIDQNAYTFNFSLEYRIIDILGISAGYSGGNLGVNDNYQSDLSYANKSSSIGGGVFVDVGEMITINAGYTFVMYDDYTEAGSYQPTGFPSPVPYNTTYGKNTSLFGIGIDLKF